MFKFFRQYNKIILVFGATLLMVAFLIQGTLGMFMGGSQESLPVGSIAGKDITLGERERAAMEIDILGALHPGLGAMAQQLADQDPLKWLLMVHEARQMGLSASDAEVQTVLQQLGLSSEQLQRFATASRLSPFQIEQAIRHWLILSQYRQLVLGQEFSSPLDRLLLYSLMQQAQATGNMQLFQQVIAMAGEVDDSQRLSEPLIQHFLYDQQATVAGEAVLVDSTRYLDKVPPPTQAKLQALFEQYREDLPGTSEPYGFGYRIPSRVKLEYLAIPFNQVQAQVRVSVAESLAYYDDHAEEFRAAPPATATAPATETAPEIQSFEDVREQVIDRLKAEKAKELADRMVKAAQAMLLADVRRLHESNGYRTVPEGFTATPLEQIADRLAEQFGVRPELHDYTDEWLPVSELAALPGLGQSALADRSTVTFSDYVRSARELEPEASDPLVSLYHLQTQVPSLRMAGRDGSLYLFRLAAAEISRVPQSLDEVREQVSADAWQLAAYEALLADREQWLSRASAAGLEELAAEEGLMPLNVTPTPRRVPDYWSGLGGGFTAPSVPGIGQSEAFIDAMFTVAERISDNGRTDVATAPTDARLGAAAIAPQLSLALFRVDAYQPLTRNEYNQAAAQSSAVSLVNSALRPTDVEMEVATDTLSKRVGYVPDTRNAEPAEPANLTPQKRPGSL